MSSEFSPSVLLMRGQLGMGRGVSGGGLIGNLGFLASQPFLIIVAEFREWLRRYAWTQGGQERVSGYRRLMESMADVSSGRSYSRDELNAR